MFTGIIESTGSLQTMQELEGDLRLVIASDELGFEDIQLGDSIAANGICLTVVDMTQNTYSVDVSRETIAKTALQQWQVGDILNLEKAMLPSTRFGGHMVSGHVDGVGSIEVIKQDARSIYIEIAVSHDLKKYVATKGSVTVDGISLTTNLVKDNVICLNIIPHTAAATNIARHWQLKRLVNIEVDLIARYLERLLQVDSTSSTSD